MTTHPTVVNEDANVGAALDIFAELDIRHLPVVRAGEIVGMLSDRDLRELGMHTVEDLESLDRLRSRMRAKVTEVMSADVVSVDRAADVREVVDLMVEEKIGAVPVVDPGTRDLVGIVSYIDVLRALADQLE